MKRDNLVDVTEFLLSTGSNPLQVQVGTNDNKASRRTVSQISVQIIKELQIVLELYLNRTKQMISVLRKGMEKKSSIASYIFGKLQEIEESISNFCNINKVFILEALNYNHITLNINYNHFCFN